MVKFKKKKETQIIKVVIAVPFTIETDLPIKEITPERILRIYPNNIFANRIKSKRGSYEDMSFLQFSVE